MYFSRSFVLAILPFTAAIPAQFPLAQPSASHGIAIPIAKHASFPLGDPSLASLLASEIQNSVAKVESAITAYERNTGKRHPLSGGIKTLSKRSTANSTIPLTNHNSYMWYGNISVGTPPVNFTVNFDTGSSDIFLPSTHCITENCVGRKKYDPSASTTSHDFGEPFSFKYLDNTFVTGDQYTDVVSIAGLVAKNQRFGAAKVYPGGLETRTFPSDGLMGMAFQSISRFVDGAIPLFQNLISQGAVTSPIFSFNLAPSGSELFLGGFNPDYKEDDFTWVPVFDGGLWMSTLDKITLTVNGSTHSVVGKINATFDTGSSLIFGDDAGIERFYKPLHAHAGRRPDGLYHVPCDFNISMSVYIGKKEIKISPESFKLGPTGSSNNCYAGAASRNLTGDYWILGDVFLQNVYSAWDMGSKNGEKRIGFADLRNV